MHTTICRCDKCGKEIPYDHYNRVIIDYWDSRFGESREVCDECLQTLVDYLSFQDEINYEKTEEKL